MGKKHPLELSAQEQKELDLAKRAQQRQLAELKHFLASIKTTALFGNKRMYHSSMTLLTMWRLTGVIFRIPWPSMRLPQVKQFMNNLTCIQSNQQWALYNLLPIEDIQI